MNNKRIAVILAAGMGSRMHCDSPKCAVLVNGKPMVQYIIEACNGAGVNDIVLVIGHKKEAIIECTRGYKNITYVEQKEQLGTGHAVICCNEVLKDVSGTTLILPGDMPLITSDYIKKIIDEHELNNSSFTILSTFFENPFGYGRIVRNSENNVIGIVEEKEASEEIKKINEVNTGLYAADNKLLFEALAKIDNNNSKGEYYLTDVVKILCNDHKVSSYTVDNDFHLTGINDLETLAYVEELLKK